MKATAHGYGGPLSRLAVAAAGLIAPPWSGRRRRSRAAPVGAVGIVHADHVLGLGAGHRPGGEGIQQEPFLDLRQAVRRRRRGPGVHQAHAGAEGRERRT